MTPPRVQRRIAMRAILPSLPAYIGLVLALWSSAYVATRTSYAANTLLVRLALISAGGGLLGAFLSGQAPTRVEAMVWQLATLPFATLAPWLWCLWTARTLPGTPHVPREWRHLFLIPAATVTVLVAKSLSPLRTPSLIPHLPLASSATLAFATATVSVTVALAGASVVIFRALDVAIDGRDRHALRLMLAGTLAMALGGLGPGLLEAESSSVPTATAPLLLTAGIVSIAYSTVIYTQRARRRVFNRDAVSSATVALGIGAVYVILIDLILFVAGTRALPYILAVLAGLSALLISYGEGLRLLLDRLVVGRSRQMERTLLRMLARRLAAPRVSPEQMLREVLEDTARVIKAGRLSLVVPQGEEMQLVASYGEPPAVLPPLEALRARRIRVYEQEGFSHSVPLLDEGIVRGLLLIGGWRAPNTAVHLYSELEYLGTILAVLVHHAYQTTHNAMEWVLTEEQIDTDQVRLSWLLQRFPRAEVCVRLLAPEVSLERNGQPLDFPEVAIGRRRLRHIVAYLVLSRGTFSSYSTLSEDVTSRRAGDRPTPGLRGRLNKVFKEIWNLPEGMVSLESRRARFEPSPVWYTDIDLIEAHLVQAEAEIEGGNMDHASRHFREAHSLSGRRVLSEMDFLPAAAEHLREWELHWATVHKRLLQSYGEHELREGGEQVQLVLKLATELASTYSEDEAVLRAAARLAQRAGDPARAREWLRLAQSLAAEDHGLPDVM
jgi:hypothetical protein